MRRLTLIILSTVIAACSTAPQPARHDSNAEAKLQQALAGKVAGRPVDCLPTYSSADMIRIDDDTVLFRDGPNRVYRNELGGSCSGLGSPHYALVTTSHGGGRICRGDFARVVDAATGMNVGSCVIGEFVPYTRTAG
ncbi:MAG TPA: DUF6491 family protein [Sphingomicrobium sp.]|jgi:hypothetical protein